MVEEGRTDKRRRLPHTVGGRFTAREVEQIKAAAVTDGLTVSTLVRRAVLLYGNLRPLPVSGPVGVPETTKEADEH